MAARLGLDKPRTTAGERAEASNVWNLFEALTCTYETSEMVKIAELNHNRYDSSRAHAGGESVCQRLFREWGGEARPRGHHTGAQPGYVLSESLKIWKLECLVNTQVCLKSLNLIKRFESDPIWLSSRECLLTVCMYS
jgi:hypothetical protein